LLRAAEAVLVLVVVVVAEALCIGLHCLLPRVVQ
jgi:hypothetical protein